MPEGLIVGCRKTRQTAQMIARIAKWDYTETYVDSLDGYKCVFRYGNSAELNMPLPEGGHGSLDQCASSGAIYRVNLAKYIKLASDKLEARKKMGCNEVITPLTYSCSDMNWNDWPEVFPAVIRPIYHMKGRDFQLINNYQELANHWAPGYYCSEMVLKRDEYRVIGLQGKVLEVSVKVKMREDADNIIRNHSHGWKFQWVPYEEAHRNIVIYSMRAIKALGLQFGAVDLCLDENNKAIVFEVNTAPGMIERKAEKLVEKLRTYLVS